MRKEDLTVPAIIAEAVEIIVGLVYIGCYVKGHTEVKEFHFTGNRAKNRDYAVVRALTFLREELVKERS